MNSLSRDNNLPFLKEDIYLVVEGETDELFINKILSFIPSKYNVRVRIANGNGNIPIHVNILKKIYSFSKIYVLYDLDANYKLDDIKRFLKNKEVTLPEKSIFFVNPCIEYLISIVEEFNEEKFHAKKDYKDMFKKYYNINDYGGHIPQIEKIISLIKYDDAMNFLKNLDKASMDDNYLPSSNFKKFINIIKNK